MPPCRFATLVEYIGTDHATPQFEAGRQFHYGDVLTAMQVRFWACLGRVNCGRMPLSLDESSTTYAVKKLLFC